MYIWSQRTKISADGRKWFTGFLKEPTFTEPRKLLNARTWDIEVDYVHETYVIYTGRIFRGFPQGDLKRIGAGRAAPDTTYANWPEQFERIFKKHSLQAWEPSNGWKWPEFVSEKT